MSYASTLLQLTAHALLTSCTSQPDATAPPAAAPARPTRDAGEYCWRDADNREMGGTLTAYPESDSTIIFYLESNDGAPAYHMANALGRAHLRGDTAAG